MSALDTHRFIINTGKGGVGKTTVSIAQAVAMAAAGRRVLLMEFNTSGRVAPAVDVPIPAEAEIVEAVPNLWIVNATPGEALREYALMILKVKALYRAVFENRVVDKLLKVMPGLPELTLLGKAFHHEGERRPDGSPRFDVVILDAPATGHGMFLLQIPQVITRALGTGHMAEQSTAMLGLLEDHERTIVNLVTLAEEMPVHETIEMHAQLRDAFDVRVGYVIANAILPARFDAQDRAAIDAARAGVGDGSPLRPLLDAAHFQDRRRAMQLRYVDQLRAELSVPVLQVPFSMAARLGRDEYLTLGSTLLEAAREVDA